jgi:hypothetical protein
MIGNTQADASNSSPPTSGTASGTAAAIKRAAQSNTSPAAIIQLSNAALAALNAQRETADTSGYTAYFPTRDGKGASTLAAAVGNPGGVSSSANKSFAQVATDARTRMDAEYAAMTAAGQPFSADSDEGKDWYTLMGDLDRRSLYAVASNAGNQFSAQEQDIAKSIMRQQQGLAMGLYTGPTSQAASFRDPFAGNSSARLAAARAFLNDASAEEKQSSEWIRQNTLLSQVAPLASNSLSDTTTTQPTNLFGYLAQADSAQNDAASTIYSSSAAYAQLARYAR